MDPAQPAMYWRAVAFSTAKGDYTNLIYRVHFPEVPVNLVPFFVGAGSNMGLFVVITLDADLKPVLGKHPGHLRLLHLPDPHQPHP